jgi:hypothetical protein
MRIRACDETPRLRLRDDKRRRGLECLLKLDAGSGTVAKFHQDLAEPSAGGRHLVLQRQVVWLMS